MDLGWFDPRWLRSLRPLPLRCLADIDMAWIFLMIFPCLVMFDDLMTRIQWVSGLKILFWTENQFLQARLWCGWHIHFPSDLSVSVRRYTMNRDHIVPVQWSLLIDFHPFPANPHQRTPIFETLVCFSYINYQRNIQWMMVGDWWFYWDIIAISVDITQ